MYPWIIHGSSDIQCSSHPSNLEIQCIHGLSMDYLTSNVVVTPVIRNYEYTVAKQNGGGAEWVELFIPRTADYLADLCDFTVLRC